MQHRSDALHEYFVIRLIGGFLQTLAQPIAEAAQLFVRVVALEYFDGRHCRRHARIAGVHSAGVDYRSVGNELHIFLFTHQSTDGVAAGHGFAEHGQVGNNIEVLLGAAHAQPEAGDHFVQNEENVVAVAQVADALQKTGLRRNAAVVAHHAFGDDGANFLVALADDFLQ